METLNVTREQVAAMRQRAQMCDDYTRYREEMAEVERLERLLARREREKPLVVNQWVLDRFVNAYLEALFWSEQADETEGVLCNEDMKTVLTDCRNFLEKAMGLIQAAGLSWDQAGHDFCLTRNGHGTGFWDRGLGETGEELTAIAESFGSQTILLDSDKNPHLF